MTPAIEILVHVSGPSRGADDARYREEALGFLEFDIAERHTIVGPGARTENVVEQTSPHVETVDAEDHQSQELETSSGAEKATDNSSVRDLPDQLPPWRSPIFSRRPAASTLPWTATKQTPHLLIERTPALPRPQTGPTPSTPSQAPHLRRSQSDSWQTPPSEIPDSQPTPRSLGPPDIPSSPSLKRPFASSSPSPRHASPPAKRPRLQLPSSPPFEDPSVERRPLTIAPFSLQSSTEGPLPDVPSSPPSKNPAAEVQHPVIAPPSSSPSGENPPATTTPPPPPPANDPWQNLEIHPPPPQPTHKPLKTPLTNTHKIQGPKPAQAQRYKPLTTTRTPETLERGHWLVPMHTWNERQKRDFWVYLNDFVGRGQAGWGTWCVREVQRLDDQSLGVPTSRESDKENQVQAQAQAPTQQQGDVVKIYCWGEVVGEVWMLLFIASKRDIKGVGARWVDAGGVPVVLMK